MATTWLVGSKTWTAALAEIIRIAEDGDTIVVYSPAQVELVSRGIQRTRPKLNVNIQLKGDKPTPCTQ